MEEIDAKYDDDRIFLRLFEIKQNGFLNKECTVETMPTDLNSHLE